MAPIENKNVLRAIDLIVMGIPQEFDDRDTIENELRRIFYVPEYSTVIEAIDKNEPGYELNETEQKIKNNRHKKSFKFSEIRRSPVLSEKTKFIILEKLLNALNGENQK